MKYRIHFYEKMCWRNTALLVKMLIATMQQSWHCMYCMPTTKFFIDQNPKVQYTYPIESSTLFSLTREPFLPASKSRDTYFFQRGYAHVIVLAGAIRNRNGQRVAFFTAWSASLLQYEDNGRRGESSASPINSGCSSGPRHQILPPIPRDHISRNQHTTHHEVHGNVKLSLQN